MTGTCRGSPRTGHLGPLIENFYHAILQIDIFGLLLEKK